MARYQYFAAILLSIFSLSTSIFLPNLTGHHQVGTITLELLNSRASPARDLMLSFFYPISTHHQTTYPLAASLPPQSAAFLDTTTGVPPGVFESISTNSHLGAPISHPRHFPILLFSPGQGVSRLLYTATAEDIASQGYIVVTVDHPNDTSFIEYPDGRVATWEITPFLNLSEAIPYVDRRVGDLRWVLDSFSNDTFVRHIPGFKKHHRHGHKSNCFQVYKVGVFGHSLGGAAAASVMLADRRFVAGVNLDGAIIGNAIILGLSQPFMFMSSAVHKRTNDATWASFWGSLRGYKRDLAVAGTRHLSFSDYAPLAQDAVALGLLERSATEVLVGSIDGVRMVKIEGVYVGSFFDRWLKDGRGRLLDGPSELFPEVSFNV